MNLNAYPCCYLFISCTYTIKSVILCFDTRTIQKAMLCDYANHLTKIVSLENYDWRIFPQLHLFYIQSSGNPLLANNQPHVSTYNLQDDRVSEEKRWYQIISLAFSFFPFHQTIIIRHIYRAISYPMPNTTDKHVHVQR